MKKGLTVLELLLYIGIASVIMGIMSSLYIAIIQSQIRIESRAALTRENEFLTSKLEYYIQHSSSILAPLPGQESDQLQIKDSQTNTQYNFQEYSGKLTIQYDTSEYTLSSTDVTMSNFHVTNTGYDNTRGLAQISYTLTDNMGQNISIAEDYTLSPYYK